MPRWVIDSLIIIGAAVLIYFGGNYVTSDNSQNPVTQSVDLTYGETAEAIAGSINDISPTPPTGDAWVVERVDFVRDQNFSYVTYQDTRNIFRIMVSAHLRDGKPQFRTVATFEPAGVEPLRWRLITGQDLTNQVDLISYIYDPDQKIWVESQQNGIGTSDQNAVQ